MSVLLVWLFFLHFLGDFVFQNNWMAHNKSKQFLPLISHVGIYTLTLWIGTFYLSPAFAIVNGLTHILIDYYTSRMNAKLYQNENKHWFFVGIGFDQFLHAATIVLTYNLLWVTLN